MPRHQHSNIQFIFHEESKIKYIKPDYKILRYRQQKALLNQFDQTSDILEFLEFQIKNKQSVIHTICDVTLIQKIKERLLAVLRQHVNILQNFTKGLAEANDIYSRLNRIMEIIKALSLNEQYRINQKSFHEEFLRIMIFSENHKLISEILKLFSLYSFEPDITLIYHYVRNFMEHLNSYNNRKIPLKETLKQQQIVQFNYVQNKEEIRKQNKLISINVQLNQFQNMNFYAITNKIIEMYNLENLEKNIYYALLNKVRFCLSKADDKIDLINSILLSYKMFSFICLIWKRSEENKAMIPNIFIIPPDYNKIFNDFLELFLDKDCPTQIHITIFEVIESILNLQEKIGEDNILKSFIENFNHIQKIITDINYFLKGKKPIYVNSVTLENKKFLETCLKLFSLNHVETDYVFAFSYDIVQSILYSKQQSSKQIILLAGNIAIACCQDQTKQNKLIQFLIDQLEKGESKHLGIYCSMLNLLFSQETKRSFMQRNSTNLAKKIVESKIFPTVSKILESPFDKQSLTMEIIELVSNICSQSPFLTDKLSQIGIIPILLKILSNVSNYPKQLYSLVQITTFFHHICLKDGEVRKMVLENNSLETFIQIYQTNQFCSILSLTQKQGNNLFSSLSRFLTNITICSNSVFKGIYSAFQKVVEEMEIFEKQFDKFMTGEKINETVKYEFITMKINNLLKLIQKLTHNMVAQNDEYSQLCRFVQKCYYFKYLNIHNAIQNKWLTSTAKIKDQLISTNNNEQKIMKQQKIMTDIRQILQQIKLVDLQQNIKLEVTQNTYFQLLEEVQNKNKYKSYLNFLIHINRLDRCVNVVKNNFKEHFYGSSEIIDIISLIGILDQYRFEDQVDFLKIRFSEMKKPHEQKELKDYIKTPLKQIAQRNNYPLLFQQTIKKLVGDLIKLNNYETNSKVARLLTKELYALDSIGKVNTLRSVYKTKLKLENIQLLIEGWSQIVKNNDFPINFNLFVFYFNEGPNTLFNTFTNLINNCVDQINQQNQKIKLYTQALRAEILNRLLIIANNFFNLNITQDQQQEQSTAQRSCVNYVLEKLQNGLMQMVFKFPQKQTHVVESTRIIIKNFMDIIFNKIDMFLNLNQKNFTKCNIKFTIQQSRALSNLDFISKIKENSTSFFQRTKQSLTKFSIYIPPLFKFIHQYFSTVQFMKINKINEYYKQLATQTIIVAKNLFENYDINLKVSHPRIKNREYSKVDILSQIAHFSVLIEGFMNFLSILQQNEVIGKGQFHFDSGTIGEIVKLATQIVNNSKQIFEVQKDISNVNYMIKRVLGLLVQYQHYQSWWDQKLPQIKKQEKKFEKTLLKRKKKDLKRRRKQRNIQNQNNLSQFKTTNKQQSISNNTKPKKETHTYTGRKNGIISTVKEPKPSKLNFQVSEFYKGICIQSKQIPILTNDILQFFLVFLFYHIESSQKKNKLIVINPQEILSHIFSIKMKDNHREGIIAIISKIGLKTMSTSHIRVQIEAIIKRFIYQKQKQDPNIKTFQFKSLRQIVQNYFGSDYKMEDINHILNLLFKCQIDGKETEILMLPNEEQKNPVITLKEEIDLFSINSINLANSLKTKRKSSQKEGMINNNNEQQLIKCLDYAPDGYFGTFIKNLIENSIENLLDCINNKKNNIQQNSQNVFNFDITIKALHAIVRQSPIIIPFITRYKCKKIIANCVSKYDNDTKKFILDLISKGKENTFHQSQQVTFISLLIRLFTTFSFDRVKHFIFEICLDNYVLAYKSSKGNMHPLGFYIRSKIIQELGYFNNNSGWTRTLSYLDLFTTLLNIKEFAKQSIQQPIITYLHKQLIQTSNEQNIDFFIKYLPFISNPLTIIHNINININICKDKPLIIRGKLNQDTVYEQLIPKSYLKKSNFLEDWPYVVLDEEQQNQSDRLNFNRRIGFFEIGQQSNQDDSDIQTSTITSQDSDEPAVLDDLQFESNQNQITEQHGEGWTSEQQQSEENSEIQEQEIHEVHDNYDDDQQLIQQEDNRNLSQIASQEIIQEMYESENEHDYPDIENENDNDNSSDQKYNERMSVNQFCTEAKQIIGVDRDAVNSEFTRLSLEMQKSIKKCLLADLNLTNITNPMLIRLKKQELFLICNKIYKDIQKYDHTLYDKIRKQIFHFDIDFPMPKIIYDDTNIFHQHFGRRRHGQLYINRAQFIEANQNIIQINANIQGEFEINNNIRIIGNQEEQMNQPMRLQQGVEMSSQNQQGQQQQQREQNAQNQGQRNVQQQPQQLFMDINQGFGELGDLQLPFSQNDRINQLLRENNIDVNQFAEYPREIQEDIINNILFIGNANLQNNQQFNNLQNQFNQYIQEQRNQNDREEQIQQQQQNQQNKQQEEDQPEDKRRKLSIEYVKKIAKDPRQILIKQKRESKIYVCQDQFIITLLNLLYLDQNSQSCLPYELIKALSMNPINENRFLALFMIILKHPDLQNEKNIFEEDHNKFPKTIITLKNNQIATDYEHMGYNLVSLKILHILSHLSKTNPSAMLESSHHKIKMLQPEWYQFQQKPYYLHLISLIEEPKFKGTEHLTFLIETLFNITNHYCMKFIQDPKQQFLIKLAKEDIRLICSLLESDSVSPQSVSCISEIIILLCLDKNNLNTFITTLYYVLDQISIKLIKQIENKQEQKQNGGQYKLHNILLIISEMFQSEYKSKLENKNIEKAQVKLEVIHSFKTLIECKSLQQLCKNCVEYLCQHTQEISPLQQMKLSSILECFFIIYKIIQTQEEDKKKKRNISVLGELNEEIIFKKDFQYLNLEVLYNYICTKGKTILNSLLKQKLNSIKKMRKNKEVISIFHQPIISVLAKNPSVIDFQNKRTMFKTEIKNLKMNKHYHQIHLVMDRNNIIPTSMHEILKRNKDQLKGKLHIQFQGEDGEDAGGLTREWFMLLSKQMFNPNYAIFKPSSTGNTYQPSPYSYINQNHLQLFRFVGRIVGKALHDGHMLDAYFTPAFYKHILGRSITYHDMEEQDYEFYKNMKWISENDITGILDLTFSYQHDKFGEIQMKDLIPNGSNIPVTEQNKIDYVQRLCYAKMATAVQKQIQAFLQGFHDLIPPQLVSIFDPKELQLMISGLPTIDIQDLKDNTELVNYDKSDNVIIWLFQVLEDFDLSLRASFLQFVTGTSRVPSEGFSGLRGLNGPQKFNIHKDFEVTKLPRAHTCFNQLDLPNYPTKQILLQKLTIAITQGKQGFGMI